MKLKKVFLHLLVFVVQLFAAVNAFSETTDTNEYAIKMFPASEVSCSHLAVFEVAGAEPFANMKKLKRLAFDLSECERLIGGKIINPLTQAMKELFGKVAAEEGVDFTNSTAVEIAEREKINREFNEKFVGDLQKNMSPLYQLCRELKPTLRPNVNRICFLNAPNKDSSAMARVQFDAIVSDSIASDKVVCAPNPISKKLSVEKEFQQIQKLQEPGGDWSNIRLGLEKDGFFCKKSEEDVCLTVLSAVMILSKSAQNFTPELKIAPQLAVPFLANVYLGKWHEVASFGPCLDGTVRSVCPTTKPVRGATEGICMSGNQGMFTGMSVSLLNGLSVDN